MALDYLSATAGLACIVVRRNGFCRNGGVIEINITENHLQKTDCLINHYTTSLIIYRFSH